MYLSEIQQWSKKHIVTGNGRFSTSFRAERGALKMAAETLMTKEGVGNQIIFLSYALGFQTDQNKDIKCIRS